MKRLLFVTIILIFGGCSTANQPSPSQNPALNSVSKSTAAKEKKGLMQESLDSWIHDDWEKNTKDFEEKKSVHEKKQEQKTVKQQEKSIRQRRDSSEKGFLQHYVDKAVYYNEKTKKETSPSHVEELNSLPAIGK